MDVPYYAGIMGATSKMWETSMGSQPAGGGRRRWSRRRAPMSCVSRRGARNLTTGPRGAPARRPSRDRLGLALRPSLQRIASLPEWVRPPPSCPTPPRQARQRFQSSDIHMHTRCASGSVTSCGRALCHRRCALRLRRLASGLGKTTTAVAHVDAASPARCRSGNATPRGSVPPSAAPELAAGLLATDCAPDASRSSPH